ncbi:hypothetical protein OROHE_006155 [Orobanche hederae]
MERFFKRKLSSSGSPSTSNMGNSNARPVEVDEILANLQADPGLRTRMVDYSPNIRDEIRRAYLQKGPCQPRNYKFPQTNHSGINRRFVAQWFDEYDWLEYNIAKDAAFCLHCYLFKSNFDQVGGDAFTGVGFNNWKKAKERFNLHVGVVGSIHNQVRGATYDLMHQSTHIETILIKQTSQARADYRTCLSASLKCIKYLLRQGLSFRGHDESPQSNNRSNYLELLQFLADHDEKVKAVVLENAPGNVKLIAPSIQKELVKCCAKETIDLILSDIKGRYFSLMVDEARDVSVKEQMAMVLRYVNDKGQIIERFVGVQHVTDTTSSALKESVDKFFSSSNLSFSKLRGQGYDGASNMRGEFNGLKTKILKEQPCAFYIHCFAHQLQLALVAVAKKNIDVNSFFTTANSLVNIVGASCKRRDALRAQCQEELYTVSAMSSVKTCKENLQLMRDNEFEELVDQASSFSNKYDITIPTMDEEYVIPGRSRRNAPIKTNSHRYRVEIFIHVIDGQLVELNDLFNEVSTELLTCLACLSPRNNFIAFDKRKLVRLAQFYPYDFSERDLLMLEDQLGVYIHHMRSSGDFSQLDGIGNLSEKMVEKKMHEIFSYVYLLLTLVLVLPVATASVERAFSAMNIIKSPLRNRMGDEWLNNSLIVYIEKDIFACVDNETIMQRFQNMGERRRHL